ncbi:MAG TPA: hypothetical protein VM285_11080 [Polyangia bacterium]|nr:hypothetical protein [Polyangia bacterium]
MGSWLGCAFLAVALAAHQANAADPPQPRGTLVVWIGHPDDPGPATFSVTASRLDDVGVTVVLDRSPVAPDRTRTLETLAVYRAAAVLWHEADGTLGVLLRGGSGPESFEVGVGSPDEQALYVRELLVARLLGENPSADLLITAPGELVPSPEPRQLPVTRPRPEDRNAPDAPPAASFGPRIALGWRWRVHLDEVTWTQHGIAAHLPAWRFESGLELRAVGAIGLPTRIGDPGVAWLELTELELGIEAGVRPVRGRIVDIELFGGAGAYCLRAAAFLPDGTSRSMKYLAGQVVGGVGVAWRPAGRLELRLHGGVARVLGPGWFSINGRGDFGAEPWQPSVGLDLSVALPGG